MNPTEQPPPVRSIDSIEGLWRFYEEHAEEARQHETLRATVTSILSGIAAAVVGLAGLGGLNLADIPAGIVVVLLALLGVALNLKHYERNRMHTRIMGETRKEITRLQGDVGARSTQQIREAAVKKHNDEFKILSGIHLHTLWLFLPLMIGAVGVLLLVLSVIGVPAK